MGLAEGHYGKENLQIIFRYAQWCIYDMLLIKPQNISYFYQKIRLCYTHNS